MAINLICLLADREHTNPRHQPHHPTSTDSLIANGPERIYTGQHVFATTYPFNEAAAPSSSVILEKSQSVQNDVTASANVNAYAAYPSGRVPAPSSSNLPEQAYPAQDILSAGVAFNPYVAQPSREVHECCSLDRHEQGHSAQDIFASGTYVNAHVAYPSGEVLVRGLSGVPRSQNVASARGPPIAATRSIQRVRGVTDPNNSLTRAANYALGGHVHTDAHWRYTSEFSLLLSC
jgi:hypothetical protein